MYVNMFIQTKKNIENYYEILCFLHHTSPFVVVLFPRNPHPPVMLSFCQFFFFLPSFIYLMFHFHVKHHHSSIYYYLLEYIKQISRCVVSYSLMIHFFLCCYSFESCMKLNKNRPLFSNFSIFYHLFLLKKKINKKRKKCRSQRVILLFVCVSFKYMNIANIKNWNKFV